MVLLITQHINISVVIIGRIVSTNYLLPDYEHAVVFLCYFELPCM